jgi:hypothetical protein
VVFARLRKVPRLRFFTAQEARTVNAIADRLLPQDDHEPHERVPITPFIDQALFDDDTDGIRKADMPWEQEAWKRGVTGLDETSQIRFDAPFTALTHDQQDQVLAAVQPGQAEGQTWQELPPSELFSMVLQQVISVYYAHPRAWAEIGWPGPAGKRGYMRTGSGRIDPWQPRPAHEVSSVPLIGDSDGGEAAGGTGGATH